LRKNCWGIKGNWIDTPMWFLRFLTYLDGRYYFAMKYWDYHYKKNIDEFVYTWSMTDREIYTKFMEDRYWKIYNELEYLYMTN
jgi:hypothetical protein